MKKLLWSVFVLIILLIFIGLSSCIQTGDEDRPGIRVSADLILSKIWEVTLFQDDGKDKTAEFQDIYLEFRPNFIFRITKGCEVIEGEWILSADSTLLVIRIPDESEPLSQLEDEWVLSWLSESEIHLIEQDNRGDEEFHLKVAPLPALNCQLCNNFSNILIDGVWSITLLTAGANDVSSETSGSYLDFQANGAVTLHTGDEEITGTWAITDNCQALVIQWADGQTYSDIYARLENNWFSQYRDHQTIELEAETDSKLHLTKGLIPNCEEIKAGLLNTSWYVDFMTINDDDVSDYFIGTGLTFLENNQLATEVTIGPAVLGDWMLLGNCDKLDLNIPVGQLKELSREWVIIEISGDQMVLVFEEGTLRMELHLRKGKPEPSAHCMELIDFLIGNQWTIADYSENDQSDDVRFEGYNISLHQDGSLLIWNADKEFSGSWYPIGDCEYIAVDMEQNSEVATLSGRWKIISYDDYSINLVYEKMSKRKEVELRSN